MGQEIWKPVNVMGGILADDYEVSNFGNVRSYIKNRWGKRKEPKLLKPSNPQSNFYRMVHLRIGDKNYKSFTIHQLVASAFLPNPNDYRCINHKDGNKKNNRVENLEWCTSSQNNWHASLSGLRGKGAIRSLETNEVFVNIAEASRKEGRSKGYITNHLRGHKDSKNLREENILYEFVI